MAFEWAYSLDGSEPIIEKFPVVASGVFSYGEMATLTSGEAVPGATNDATFLGAAVEDMDNTVDGHYVHVIVNRYAVYRVTDANARTAGDVLDLGSGGLTVATDSNHDLRVVKSSSATEPTYVMIAPGEHWLDA